MIRVFRRNAGFAALVVLTLAVGIGATTAAVNVAANVLLSPLPVGNESRLVQITKKLPGGSTAVPFAVLLAGVGVFGVLGAFVAQRSRELGLRVALGADLADLRRLVLSKLGWPALLGLSAGTCAAFAAAPLIRPLLFQVTTFDARALAAGWMVLALVSAGAAVVPLRRASRIDPATLLRSG